MRIQSPEFASGEAIPEKYTCDGEDISPPLEISGVPKNAKSLALIVDDPDAPHGTWTHWVVWDIEPDTDEIGEGELPYGAKEGITSARTKGYHGPCPPNGTHRYFFKLFALDSNIELSEKDGKDALLKASAGHITETAELMGIYERKG